MSANVIEDYSLDHTGALGVFANYMKSSDSVPTTSNVNRRNNNTSTKKISIEMANSTVPHLSPSPAGRGTTRASTPNSESLQTAAKTVPIKLISESSTKISNFDIGLKMISDLTGKDKIAKIALYSLRIIMVYAEKFSKLYPGNVKDGEKYNLLLQVFRSPALLLGFLSKLFIKRSAGVINGLSLYRQLLRFGKNPFRLRNLLLSLTSDFKYAQQKGLQLGALNFYGNWFNEAKLGEIINFYYGLTDEILVLYKLGVLTNPGLRKWAGVHECYSWYFDIILGLKQNYYKLKKLNEREASIKLNQQVRIKARQVIKNLKLDNASSPVRNTLTTDQLDSELITIAKEKKIVILSLAGLMCDFCFDTVDVFDLKVDKKLYLSFGLVSACCGASKVYHNFKDAQ